MVHQLAPLLHVAVRDRQNGKPALFRAAARRVARQHGQIGVVLEQLHDHARALQLQKRPDRQLLVCQLHVELVAIAVELRHEHERLIDEVGQLELLGGGERVLGAGDDDDLLRTLEQLDPLRVVTHVVERVDQVDFIVHEHIRERFRVALDQLRVHMRTVLMIQRQDLPEAGRHDGFDRADAQRAGQVALLHRKRHGARRGRHDIARVGDELLPVVGDGYGFSDAVKQAHAQLVFELLDLHRNGGLGIPQGFCGLGEAL